jgi:peroxiredoxin
VKKILLILILSALLAFQQNSFRDLNFRSYNKGNFTIEKYCNNKAIVFIFLMPDCPFCQKYTKTLNELQKKYAAKNIQLTGVITGDLYTDEEANTFIKDYKISFPVIHDPAKQLLRKFRTSVSPSVVVADNNGNIIYKGLIDNWPITPGSTRQRITENYLNDVLQQITTGKPVTIKNTDAVGCIIE